MNLQSRIKQLEKEDHDSRDEVVLYEVDGDFPPGREEESLSEEDRVQLAQDLEAGRTVILLRTWGTTPRGRLGDGDE